MIAVAVVAAAADASRAPTQVEVRGVRAAALRSLHGSGWVVSHIRISTIKGRDGYASAAVTNAKTGVGGEMILRSRSGQWRELFLGQNDFCTVRAPIAVLDDLGFACSKPKLELQPSVVTVGAALTLSGEHFRPGRLVTLMAGPPQSEGASIGSVRARADGSFAKTVKVSVNAAPGRYVAIACQDGCTLKTTAAFAIRSQQ